MRNQFAVLTAILCLSMLSAQAAEPIKAAKESKEHLVLMSLHVGEEIQNM
jgi:hypothetical protein